MPSNAWRASLSELGVVLRQAIDGAVRPSASGEAGESRGYPESAARLCRFCEQSIDETRGWFRGAKANIDIPPEDRPPT